MFKQNNIYDPEFLRVDFSDLEKTINNFFNSYQKKYQIQTRVIDVTDKNVEIELPGYSKEEIKITSVNDILTIKANNEKRGQKEYKFKINDPSKIISSVKLENGILIILFEDVNQTIEEYEIE